MATVSTTISAPAPYYDDYTTSGIEDKNYMRILFKPGVSVQARELNQLQTGIQNQIAKFGSHIFPDNSRVLDGQISVQKNVDSIDMDMASGYQTTTSVTNNIVGQTIQISGGAVTAKVIDSKFLSGTTFKLFLQYNKTSDTSSVTSTTAFTEPVYSKVFTTGTSLLLSSTTIGTVVAVGYATKYTIGSGIYFTKGSFVKVEEQTVYLDLGNTQLEYDAQPILNVSESSVTSSADVSLRDNANGSTNAGAPGADRYKIDLQLRVLTDNATILGIASNTEAFSQQDFRGSSIKLADVVGGQALEPYDYVYSELGDAIAQRTFEESGNYTVKPFRIDIREHLNTGASRTKRGRFTAAEGGRGDQLAIDIETGVAYVQGKRRELVNKTTVALDKARDTFAGVYGAGSSTTGYETIAFQVRKGNYVTAAKIFGVPEPDQTCELYQDVGDADSPNADTQAFGSAGMGDSGFIGTCKVSSVSFTGSVFKVYLNSITMNAGFQLSDAGYLVEETGSSSLLGGRSANLTFAARLNADGYKDTKGFVLQESKEETNIFPIGRQAVSDIRNLTYCIRSQMTTVRAINATSITLDTGDSDINANDRFYSVDNNDYIVVLDSGEVTPLSTTVDPVLSNVESGTGLFKTVTLTFAGGATINDSVIVMYSAKRTSTLANAKKTVVGTETVTSDALTTLATNDRFTLQQHIDVFSIESATIDAGGGSEEDITRHVKLVDGRNNTHYGTSYAIYTGPTRTIASKTLTIIYKRFTHASTSEPFTVESYNINGFDNTHTTATAIEYEDLYFDGTEGGMSTIADAIDFRGTTVQVDPNSVITCDVNYFLPRVDRLFIDKEGSFRVQKGNSNIRPTAPQLPKESLLLYDLFLSPYTFSHTDVNAVKEKNKRYTMHDIGVIDDRLKTLEYFTALSLLERDAEGRQIFDDEGLRFNNGILVDQFAGHGIGNPSDAGYKCAVDIIENTMRPAYRSRNIGLYMGGQSGRTPADEQSLVGTPQAEPSLRLPAVDKKTLLDQPFASTAISVNPFDLAAYLGDIELTPSSDEWKSTDRRPDVTTTMDDNLDSIVSMFEDAGVIGTFWNEWETQWGGWNVTDVQNWWTGNRRARRTTTVREGVSSRDGLLKTASFRDIETDLGDRVVDVSFIPFIRSRKIYFKGTGFKPNTRLIPYFDKVNVDIYCRAATSSEYSGNTYADTSSRPSLEPQTDMFASTGLPLSNANDSPAGTMSSEFSGTVGLETDSTGTIYGYFALPNNDKLRFRTGDRVFKLIDSADVDDANALTFGEATYTARGLLNTVERNIISTRQLDFDTTRIGQTLDVTETNVTTRYWDPLAQSFVIGEYKQGIFLRDIDLFFKAVDTDLPVSIRLVKVENGIPTQKIIPLSKVSKTAAEMVGKGSDTASIATNFKFQQPIYLAYGQEYAIVVLSNSANYTMWHSEVGGTDVATGAFIQKNPYAGVSFISQNASTWTPNQATDYKMKLSYVEFSETNSTEYQMTSIMPQNRNGTAIFNATDQINATGMVLFTEDTRPQGTDVKYTLTMGDGRAYNMEPNKLTYFDMKRPASTATTVGGYNFHSSGDVRFSVTLSSTNKFLTPMVDLDRISLQAISNIINNDSTNELLPNHGNALARYITRDVKLKNASTALDVYLAINRPEGTNIEVYARFNNASNASFIEGTSPGGGSPGDINDRNFVKLAHSPIPINTDRTKFPEVNFRFDFADVLNEDTITDSIEEFTEFSVKIVMLSEGSERVPSVRELRCIATV